MSGGADNLKKKVTKYPRDLEVIDDDLDRLKVPKGWIVINQYKGHMVFVPDQYNEWVLEDEPE